VDYNGNPWNSLCSICLSATSLPPLPFQGTPSAETPPLGLLRRVHPGVTTAAALRCQFRQVCRLSPFFFRHLPPASPPPPFSKSECAQGNSSVLATAAHISFFIHAWHGRRAHAFFQGRSSALLYILHCGRYFNQSISKFCETIAVSFKIQWPKTELNRYMPLHMFAS